jgi:hypothetical protein
MGVTFTKRHRYGDRKIQPAEGKMVKKTANIEILVYGRNTTPMVQERYSVKLH